MKKTIDTFTIFFNEEKITFTDVDAILEHLLSYDDCETIGFLWTKQEFESAETNPSVMIGQMPIKNILSRCCEDKSDWITTDDIRFAINNHFAFALREAIKKSGKTMKIVADELEIPYRTLQDWKAGKRLPATYTQQIVLDRIEKLR